MSKPAVRRRSGWRRGAVGPLVALLFGVAATVGVARPARAQTGDDLSVYVMTFGPGDHPFFKFGHDAIWIQDRATKVGKVYNFGTFRFDSPKLIPDFMKGRLIYWLSVSSVERTIASYQSENRTIEVQELDLAAPEKLALAERLAVNARPENRNYKYDYFLDNCSTRVRDAIDAVTAGRLRASAHGPARLTLREQALRMTADLPWEYLTLSLVLGPATDEPGDRWGEMFIPQELARGLRAVSLPGVTGTRPLVRSQEVLFRAQREPPPEYPPDMRLVMLLAGVGIGCALFALGLAGASWPAWRVIFCVVAALWGFILGFVGCFLCFVWAFTDHVVAARNENILLCAPWALLFPVLLFGVGRGRLVAARRAFAATVAAAALATLGFLLKVYPGFHQDNGQVIALLLPTWYGLSLGLLSTWRGLRRLPVKGRGGSKS
ncbi:MAG TPA: DUF4105 domain-containing protein [Polyangia bacterium]|jgi:hypothetical protein|nr:DUF4105 domain-containing protein [Polyangia bacterium]